MRLVQSLTPQPEPRPREQSSRRSLATSLSLVASNLLRAIVILGLSSAWSNLSAQEASKPAQDAGGDENGLTYQRRVQVPQAAAVPDIIVTEFFTHGELDEKCAGWLSSTAGAIPSRGACFRLARATFAGSRFRPCRKSVFTRSATAARAKLPNRPTGPARPGSCWKPAAGKTATSTTRLPCARRSRRRIPMEAGSSPRSSIGSTPSGPTRGHF